MKILVDCRCLNYTFLTGVNAYTIRLLHCLSIVQSSNKKLHITLMGCSNNQARDLMTQFPFLINMFENNISVAKYLNYQDTELTQSSWFRKGLEILQISKNRLNLSINNKQIAKYDYVILPQPRILQLHPDSKLITIFHDIFSILDNQQIFPQSIIFNKRTCQTLVNRSHKVIAGSISTCQDVNRIFCGQTGFSNPKIQLIYPALPNLAELESKYELQSDQTDFQTLTKTKRQANSTDFEILQTKYVLAISGIEPRKNWYNLILAHKYLQDKYDWKIALVLSGAVINQKYYQKLLKIIDVNKIRNILWQVNINEQQKTQLLKNCEFVAYPSFYEGFGFPILEAFEYNKTVLTSRISSMPEIGKNCCIYANPYSYTSIANCMYLLHTDQEFKQSLVQNINTTKSQYSWNEMTSMFNKLLN